MIRSSYIICSTPRSGSYLLCELLSNIGVAGKPTEYVSLNYERHWSARWRVAGYEDFLQRVLAAGTSPNGVFGVKVHYYQLRYFLTRVRGLRPMDGVTDREVLESVFPNLKYIALGRRDRVRQAVSYVRARQSNVWWLTDRAPAPCGAPTGCEPRFTFREIDQAVERMSREEAGWHTFFDRHGIAPLEIDYEELADHPHDVVNRTLRFLDLAEPAHAERPRFNMKAQSDHRSREWAARYQRLKTAQAQRTVAAFRHLHKGENIVICGCGESLNDFDRPERFVTVGVNDVGRRFHPNYLLVLDARHKFSEERFKSIENSESDFLFTDQQLGVAHPNLVRVLLRQRPWPDFDDPHPLHFLARPWYTPYVATTLAGYMGAAYVGLIGVDFTDNHFFGQTGAYPGTRHLVSVDEHFRKLNSDLIALGTKVFNLSRISRVSAFPRLTVEEFHALRVRQSRRVDVRRPLRIVVYSSIGGAAFADALATYINCETVHYARSVSVGSGTDHGGDIDPSLSPDSARSELLAADIVLVHNGLVDREHQLLILDKPVVTVADGAPGDVDWRYVRDGFPRSVLSHAIGDWYEAAVVPFPVRIPATRAQPSERRTIYYFRDAPRLCRLDADLHALRAVAQDVGMALRIVDSTQEWWSAVSAITEGDIVVDLTGGGYGRASIAGLAAGAVVLNTMAARSDLVDAFRRCAAGERSSPFVFAPLDRVPLIVKLLSNAGPEALQAEGAAGRQWLQRHWRFEWQWDELWLPLIGEALHQAQHRFLATDLLAREGAYETL